ncbi:MAG TPA: PEP-CTERM sorting domain-containing protein [Acetobacteraceae bacterium]|nr:PEP-CTERM sorting domain-containing protein [Acetobacteraceae bacterium]
MIPNRSMALTGVILVGLIAVPIAASACPVTEVPQTLPSVACGSDYLLTQPGTKFNFPGIGTVHFVPDPTGPGLTDTIVQRQDDAVINGAPIPTQLVGLSLNSSGAVNIGGNFYDIHLGLDPGHSSTGTIQIAGDLSGGTFSSFFDVFFDLQFTPIGGAPALPDMPGSTTLSQNAAVWSPTPPPGALLVSGPDDGSAADQAANQHTGLDPLEVDFFPGVVPLGGPVPPGALKVPGDGRVKIIPECKPGSGQFCHLVLVSPFFCANCGVPVFDGAIGVFRVPEPAGLAVFAAGLLGMMGVLRRRRRSARS